MVPLYNGDQDHSLSSAILITTSVVLEGNMRDTAYHAGEGSDIASLLRSIPFRVS